VSLRIIGIGEVLWDLLPSGNQLGGAPANFACHAAALGASGCLISRVGDDELGREIHRRLDSLGVSIKTVAVDPELPTGSVSVDLNRDGQPSYTIHGDSAWDRIEADKTNLACAARCDAICFGTLAQRSESSRSAIMKILAAAPATALRVLDINLRAPFFDSAVIKTSLAHADVLKLNDQELPQVASMVGLVERSVDGQLAELIDRFSLKLIALTRGAEGSMLRSADGKMSDHSGMKVQVADAIGAGDAFTAAMVIGYLRGWDLQQINQRANEVAAFVCIQAGAIPRLSVELLERWEVRR
jgi:fructokinase